MRDRVIAKTEVQLAGDDLLHNSRGAHALQVRDDFRTARLKSTECADDAGRDETGRRTDADKPGWRDLIRGETVFDRVDISENRRTTLCQSGALARHRDLTSAPCKQLQPERFFQRMDAVADRAWAERAWAERAWAERPLSAVL